MNTVQLSGTIASRPTTIYEGKGIHFVLKARYPSRDTNSQPDFVHVPCDVFDANPLQREILLNKRPRNFRVEAVGRLEQIVCESSPGRKKTNLGLVVQRNGLLLQRVR